ncbi:MAG: DNA mismatch repair endonuclease MutL, partial [Patescibacteria group bacterium]|nr:DNA mismatch repair endonuclease MutL [Patescibacteria group bacterium]
MKTIQRLPDYLINQIAAGEIIERPAYIVKELIENSIDAGASHIKIHLERGGINRIIVQDNGCGMSREDIEEACKLHTTSKIRDAENFHGITTLGFRGEALASIAAMSVIHIESKTVDDIVGSKLIVKNNHQTIQSVGMPTGTRVTAHSLFYNQPVRKKLLQSPQTEFKHTIELLLHYAIAYPQITFELFHNGKLSIHLPKQTGHERIRDIFGSHFQEHLLPISIQDSSFSVKGFIGKPQLSFSKVNYHVSINKRPIHAKYVHQTIKEAFGILIEDNKNPVYILFITVPPETVDINIHPRKDVVRIINEQEIFTKIYESIRDTLSRHDISFMSSFVKEQSPTYDSPLLKTTLAQNLKKIVDENRSILLTNNQNPQILSIHNLYLVTESEFGILLIDQHAAHERILYELYLKEFFKQKTKQKKISLQDPILLNFSLNELLVFQHYLSDLQTMGFSIEEFSGTSYRILEIPSIFEGRDIHALIYSIIRNLDKEQFINPIDSQTKRLLAYLACRSAVKAGDPLT